LRIAREDAAIGKRAYRSRPLEVTAFGIGICAPLTLSCQLERGRCTPLRCRLVHNALCRGDARRKGKRHRDDGDAH